MGRADESREGGAEHLRGNPLSFLNHTKGAVKLKTWQLLFYAPNLNWYQRQSFNLVCIANKPHHFEGQIEAKTCHDNHSIFLKLRRILKLVQNYAVSLIRVFGIQLLNIECKCIDQDFCVNVLLTSAQKAPESLILLKNAKCALRLD